MVKDSLKQMIADGSHYLGICAGAYLAPSIFEYSETNYLRDTNGSFLPSAITNFSESKPKFGLKLCAEFIARGPFYPNQFYSQPIFDSKIISKKQWRPQVVNLSDQNDIKTKHLFIEGCGFPENPNRSTQNYSSVATYQDQAKFSFFHKKTNQPCEEIEFPAIIAQKPQANKRQSGIFLSGVHIEACVKESLMLANCISDEWLDRKVLLSNEQYLELAEAQEHSREWVVSELKSGLTYK